jgi:excisionase family DNA binding protein
MNSNQTPEVSDLEFPPYLGVQEVSKILRLSDETVKRYIREGHIKASLLPGSNRYRVLESDLRAYLEASGLPIHPDPDQPTEPTR